jgi:hypothetical protein
VAAEAVLAVLEHPVKAAVMPMAIDIINVLRIHSPRSSAVKTARLVCYLLAFIAAAAKNGISDVRCWP